ncbi:MAG: hypothetical protein M3252_04225, partial [Actinomycetota bacterium]|nr:hypothetical protein [Actinomycetota bacterium]
IGTGRRPGRAGQIGTGRRPGRAGQIGTGRSAGALPPAHDPEVHEVDEAVDVPVLQRSHGAPVRLGVELGAKHDNARDGLRSTKDGFQRYRPSERVADEHGWLSARYVVKGVFCKVFNPLERRSKTTAVRGEFVDDHRGGDEGHDFGPDFAILAGAGKEDDRKPLRRLFSHQSSGCRAGAREG